MEKSFQLFVEMEAPNCVYNSLNDNLNERQY